MTLFREGAGGVQGPTPQMTPRRIWWLCLPLFLGCAGKNVVAGEEQTKSERLAELARPWCEETCHFMEVCAPPRACDCSAGSPCDCPTVDNECAVECEQDLRAYTVGSDVCAEIGERVMTCLDGLSCEEFNSSSARRCQVTDAEKARCPNPADTNDVPPSGADDIDTYGPSSGGASSTGGTSTGGAASTGGSYTVAGSYAVGGDYAFGGEASGGTGVGSNVSCSSSTGSAGSAFGGGASTLTCEVSKMFCSDGHDYSWICARGSQMQIGCTCFVDGQVTGGFAPGVDDCPKLALVNAGCGWGLAE
jgi:hypothetical protein